VLIKGVEPQTLALNLNVVVDIQRRDRRGGGAMSPPNNRQASTPDRASRRHPDFDLSFRTREALASIVVFT
jgi:hypothetical protein